MSSLANQYKPVTHRQLVIIENMEKKGIKSLSALAEASGRTIDAVHRYYYMGNSTIKTIEPIARALGVTLAELTEE